MPEIIPLGIFCVSLIACLTLGYSIVFALIVGFVSFFIYGLYKGCGFKFLAQKAFSGVKKASNVIVIMLFIGAITASWRASGTIAYLVAYASEFISPKACLLSAFLLNALLSSLIGTSFGTSATMGVVTMSLCTAMGVPPLLAGGAILAGAFTGDRCSPLSSSAQLVCLVTATDLYKNLKLMLISGFWPFVLACGLYLVIGFLFDTTNVSSSLNSIFEQGFVLSWPTLLPALMLLTLVAFRVGIKVTMSLSTLVACTVAYFVQNCSPDEILHSLVFGFSAQDPEIGKLLDGGGLLSMAAVVVILTISCTYSGLFEASGLLKGIESTILSMRSKLGKFTTISLTALFTSMLACNQVLAVILTEQLCKKIEPNRQTMAIALEDTAIVIPALIPWSIAGAVPVATVGAPELCIVFAFFLYFLPLFGIAREVLRGGRSQDDRTPETA